MPPRWPAWASERALPVLGIDNLPGSVPLETYDLPEACVLLFGQEGDGLTEQARAECASVLSIAQYGSTRSINAGAAAAVAMHAWIRQHRVRAGAGRGVIVSAGRALWGNRHYRRLFAARTISNLGNGIMPIALAFGVLELPGATPTSLSIVLAAQAVPLIIMLPIGGVVADRLGRARVIAVTDVILSAFVFTVAALFATGNATIPLLAGLSFIMGILNGLWWPAMSGLVPDVMRDDEHLQPANAYISVASNGGLIAGNALGGLLVAAFGSGIAIAIDATTFLVAGLLVFTFRHVSKPHDSGESMTGDLLHGWRVFISFRWVWVITLSFSFIVMVLRGAEEVMGPVLALQEYGGPAGWAVVLGVHVRRPARRGGHRVAHPRAPADGVRDARSA